MERYLKEKEKSIERFANKKSQKQLKNTKREREKEKEKEPRRRLKGEKTRSMFATATKRQQTTTYPDPSALSRMVCISIGFLIV